MGDVTLSTSPLVPTSPRLITLAPLNGSRLPTAYTSSSTVNTATCSPPTSAATPRSGTSASTGHTATHWSIITAVIGYLRARGSGIRVHRDGPVGAGPAPARR